MITKEVIITSENAPRIIATCNRILKKMREDDKRKRAAHCQCRSGSPDTCPKCTDMETGEKYADQDVAD